MSDKPPSAFAIEQAMAVLNQARERILTDDAIDDELTLARELDDASADVQDILGRLLRASVHCSDMAFVAAQREADLKQRKDRYLARMKVLRQEATDLMLSLGSKKVSFPDLSAAINPGRQSVIVSDMSRLPEKYKEVSTSILPNKAEILADIMQGVVVEGAELRNPQPYVTIRTK